MTKGSRLAAFALVFISNGCNQILGLGGDPRLDDMNKPVADAPTAPIDTGAAIDTPPACVPSACEFGCDSSTNTCRSGQLWVFKTTASFPGNTFGGNDAPPDVRSATDGICLVTHNNQYSGRACDSTNTHAILHISNSDSLALMATKYHIPTGAPIYRAGDGVLVSNNWNDLTDPTKALRAAASTVTNDDDAQIWTGINTSATCLNWTSGSSSNAGTLGYTNRTEASWLGEATTQCDLLASLLCICWSSGS